MLHDEMNLISKEGRLDWVDCAKGITILLVIIGHTCGKVPRSIIFSFHMPLFFILSSRTFRFSTNKDEFFLKSKRAFKHLMVPAFILYMLKIMYNLWHEGDFILGNLYWMRQLYIFIFASGAVVSQGGGNMEVEAIGIPWFFFALFLGRSLYDYLQLYLESSEQRLVICAIFSMIGVLWGKLQWLPFSLDIVLAILPLFYFGDSLKCFNVEKETWKRLFLTGTLWIATFLIISPDWNSPLYLEFACRQYPLFPICYITAVAGTLFICEFCVLILKVGRIAYPLVYLGKNSLYLLCIHAADTFLWRKLWYVQENQMVSLAKRMSLDLVIFGVVLTANHLIKRVVIRLK